MLWVALQLNAVPLHLYTDVLRLMACSWLPCMRYHHKRSCSICNCAGSRRSAHRNTAYLQWKPKRRSCPHCQQSHMALSVSGDVGAVELAVVQHTGQLEEAIQMTNTESSLVGEAWCPGQPGWRRLQCHLGCLLYCRQGSSSGHVVDITLLTVTLAAAAVVLNTAHVCCCPAVDCSYLYCRTGRIILLQ